MARMCHNNRKIASHFRYLHGYISLAIFRKAPPNSTSYSFREKEVRANGASFKIVTAPSNKAAGPVLAAATIGVEILKGGTFAILTPSKAAPYAKGIVDLLQTRTFGKNN